MHNISVESSLQLEAIQQYFEISVEYTGYQRQISSQIHPLPDPEVSRSYNFRCTILSNNIELSLMRNIVYDQNLYKIISELYTEQLVRLNDALKNSKEYFWTRKLTSDNSRPHVAKMTQQMIHSTGMGSYFTYNVTSRPVTCFTSFKLVSSTFSTYRKIH